MISKVHFLCISSTSVFINYVFIHRFLLKYIPLVNATSKFKNACENHTRMTKNGNFDEARIMPQSY